MLFSSKTLDFFIEGSFSFGQVMWLSNCPYFPPRSHFFVKIFFVLSCLLPGGISKLWSLLLYSFLCLSRVFGCEILLAKLENKCDLVEITWPVTVVRVCVRWGGLTSCMHEYLSFQLITSADSLLVLRINDHKSCHDHFSNTGSTDTDYVDIQFWLLWI